MADTNSTIKTTVVLDATQAQQQLVKLNATASDGTKSLEERVEAKNQAVELQNKLSKQTVDQLEKEVKEMRSLGAAEKDVEKITTKLNKAKIAQSKASENGAKQQNKLNDALEDSKSKTKGLDDATGGLLGKMKAFATNPIGAVILAITAAFALLTKAIGRSEKASTTFSKIGVKIEGIFNGILAVLGPLVEFLGEKLLLAIESPGVAFQQLADIIQDQVINRFNALFIIGDAVAELLKGNFTEAAELAKEGALQLVTGLEDAEAKLTALGASIVENYTKAADATDNLANKERQLLANRIALEKLQLTSLRLAEEQRQIRDDTSRSIEERIEANKELGRILNEQAKAELEVAQQSLALAQSEVLATGKTIENLEAVGDAEIKLLEIQERITGQRSEQIVNEIGLLTEKKLAQDELNAAEQVRLDGLTERNEREVEAQIELDLLLLEQKKINGEETLAAELAILERQMAQELAVKDLTESEKAVIIEKYAQAGAKVVKTAEDAKTKSVEVAAEAGISAAAEVFGISQEVAVAQMLMAAPQAIGHSFKKAAETYVPPLSIAMGALGAATTVIPIIKGLADIKKTRFPGKKGGKGAPSGSINASAASAPAVALPPELSAIGDIGANNAARLGVDPSLGAGAGSSAAANVSGGAAGGVNFSEERYSEFQNQVIFKEDKTTIS